MKFFFSFLTIFAVNAATEKAHKLPESIKVNSDLGRKLISSARSLDENNQINYEWVENYSIKFQGCHHISQWNDEVEDEEDVRIATKRLLRFRLCPSDMCFINNAAGCITDYGDYVIDMNIFLESYVEFLEEYKDARCEYIQNNCNCDDEYCMYDCYAKHGMEYICADYNPYDGNQGQGRQNFDLANYVECSEAQFGNRRQLNDAAENFYLGPYCAEQGGAIYLGMFSDDTCTTFADDYGGRQTYKYITGSELPYADSNLVSVDCLSCMNPNVEYNGNDENNDENNDESVNELCQSVYSQAGKCEAGLDFYGGNNGACSYIQGIQVIRKNGIIVDTSSTANKIASVFIAVFLIGFIVLSIYVNLLKTKLHRASIDLSD